MLAQPISEENKRKILWDNSIRIYGQRLVEGHPLAEV
jgi:predicted TIM-barrel fold metal-dependent hydrolase